MIRTKDDPTREGIAKKDEESTNEVSAHVWGSFFHSECDNIVVLEKSKITKDARPYQQVTSSKHQTEIEIRLK